MPKRSGAPSGPTDTSAFPPIKRVRKAQPPALTTDLLNLHDQLSTKRESSRTWTWTTTEGHQIEIHSSMSSGEMKRRNTSAHLLALDSETTPSRNSTPHAAAFLHHLQGHGVFGPGDTKLARPVNHDEILEYINRSRASMSPPSQTRYERFLHATQTARNEQDIMMKVIPKLIDTEQYLTCTHTSFSNMLPLVSSGQSFAVPKPDLFDAISSSKLPDHVTNDLSGFLLPSLAAGADLPALPNFTMEVKGPGGTSQVAKAQIIHNGAYGQRAMDKLKEYSNQSRVDGHATAIGVTYTADIINYYATSSRQASGSGPTYHTTFITSDAPTQSAAAFHRTQEKLKNAREYAHNARQAQLSAVLQQQQQQQQQQKRRRQATMQLADAESSDEDAGSADGSDDDVEDIADGDADEEEDEDDDEEEKK